MNNNEVISVITKPLLLDNEEIIPNEQEIGNNEICRICYSTGDLQSLINPCDCSGTMGILHKNCLERWLEISNTTKCEICQHEFEIIRYPKSLFYFLKNPLRSSDIRYLINDIILFIFLTAIISWLIFLNLSKIRLSTTFYDKISYLIFPLSVIFIYIIWCWISFRYHIEIIKEWRSVNQLIHIINKKDIPIEHLHISASQNEENILSDIHIIK